MIRCSKCGYVGSYYGPKCPSCKEILILSEEEIDAKIEEIEKAERRVLSHILSGQIDMLYGVFMSANLPEYEKEQLGAQYNRLKSMICEENTNEGED